MSICLYRTAYNREVPNPKGRLATVLQAATAIFPTLKWHVICSGVRVFVDGYELRMQPSKGSTVCVKMPWRYSCRKLPDAATAVAWVGQQMTTEQPMKGKPRRQSEVAEIQKWWTDKTTPTPPSAPRQSTPSSPTPEQDHTKI
jgi:hypothetical protein